MPIRDGRAPEALTQSFGPLEIQVLEAIWDGSRPVAVRDLQASFPGCAYTTIMTTLDRLHKKGVLDRTKVGRAFVYQARFARREIEMRVAVRSVEELLGSGRGRSALEPLMSCFVDAVSERDRALLDDLERLLKEKRSQLSREKSR